jgi:hypothetical protein
MKYILNKTTNSRDRYTLIKEGMGGAGDPKHYPTHLYSVANGVDRGNGYQGYESITYALKEDKFFPEEARRNLIEALDSIGFYDYLHELGLE